MISAAAIGTAIAAAAMFLLSVLTPLISAWKRGAKISKASQHTISDGIYCSYCGRFEDRADAVFCAACGRRLSGR